MGKLSVPRCLSTKGAKISLEASGTISNIHIVGVPEGEERAQGLENLFDETMMKNFSNLVTEIDIQAKEAQRVLTR